MAGPNLPDREYLEPTSIIDSDNQEIIQFVKEAVVNAKNQIEQTQGIFYAARDSVLYDIRTPFFLPEHYKASNVLKRGRGYCVTKACLLCAMGRALGIPSRLGLADIRNRGASKQVIEMMGTDVFSYHGFTEFYLNGKWVKATPAFDSSVFPRHNIAPVEFDGIKDAVYPSHDLSGNPYVEYITYHGSFVDVPLNDLLNGWRKHYGEDRVQFWMTHFSEISPETSASDDLRI
ncbi:MAG: transglutaminase-like domain-containing protein [Desulfomonilaceae bacterium]